MFPHFLSSSVLQENMACTMQVLHVKNSTSLSSGGRMKISYFSLRVLKMPIRGPVDLDYFFSVFWHMDKMLVI